MSQITYGTAADVSRDEVAEFFARIEPGGQPGPRQLEALLENSAAFVTARADGRLVGIARGITDGLHGYFTDCKLDPAYQGPAAISHSGGRIEDDTYGIAAEMSRRVLEQLAEGGAMRVDVIAWGTEVDFLESLGFKRQGGLVGLTLRPGAAAARHESVAATV